MIYPLTTQLVQFCRKEKLTLKEDCFSFREDNFLSISGSDRKTRLLDTPTPVAGMFRQDVFLYSMSESYFMQTLELEAWLLGLWKRSPI